MAKVLQGSFNTAAYEGRYLVFSWTAEQDTATNISTISWQLKGAGGSGYYMAGNFKVVIDGETVYNSTTRIELWNNTVVASGTKKITHNTDGTRSFSASAQAGIYYSAVNCKGSGKWDLTDIPRAATITSIADFTDEENPVLYYSNAAGNSVTTLQAFFSVDGINPATNVHTLSKTGTNYTFNLTEAERAQIRPYTDITGTIYCHLRTTFGTTVLENTKRVGIILVNYRPSLELTVTNSTDAALQALTGANTLIKGHNKLTVSLSAAAVKGEALTKYYVTCGTQRLDYDTNPSPIILTNVDSGEVRASVVDARSQTASDKFNYNLIDYKELTCNLTTSVPTADGEIELEISGSYYSGAFGLVDNALDLEFSYSDNGEITGWLAVHDSITIDAEAGTYRTKVLINGLDYRKTYTFAARAFDKVYTSGVESTHTTTKVKPVFDWGAEDFNLNVPLHLNGVRVPLIAEEGEKDGWRYRKWDNGYCEAWKTVTVNTALNAAWGNLYVGSTTMARQNYPFPYEGKPNEQATLQSGYAAAWLFAESMGNGVNGGYASAVYNIARPAASATVGEFYISLYVNGKLLNT